MAIPGGRTAVFQLVKVNLMETVASAAHCELGFYGMLACLERE